MTAENAQQVQLFDLGPSSTHAMHLGSSEKQTEASTTAPATSATGYC